MTAVVSQRCQRKQGNALCVSFGRNSRETTKVDRRAFVKLSPGKPGGARTFQRCCLKQAAVQAVERIVAGKVLGPTPDPELVVRCLEIDSHFGVRWRAKRDTLWILVS